tara:strand:+ start:314 stop:502 length:189 start_codon:yes stop_codon:yes gene_type:complete
VQAQLDKKNSQIRKYATGGPKINRYIKLLNFSKSFIKINKDTINAKIANPAILSVDILKLGI